MRVSAKAEYACVALLELARAYGEPQPLRIKTIAEIHSIPHRFLVQILLQLKGAGLVMSVRGAGGGYQLTRKPERISVAEVIDAIDRQPEGWSSAFDPPYTPAVQAVLHVWHEVQMAERLILQRVTLADLVRRAVQGNALSYQI